MTASPLRRELIAAKVHGSFWVRSADTPLEAPTLVGFHGYGESAESHFQEMNLIPGATAWNLVSIQALHPFYSSRSGEVVASWMTKLDREEAIGDNVRYVTEVLARVVGPVTADSRRPLVAVGFSQGTAMAYRAAAGSGYRFRGVVALGGDVPPELAGGGLAQLPVALIGIGSRDTWYTEDRLDQDLEVLESQGVDCRVLRYEGGHEWTAAFRRGVGRFLEGLVTDT